MKNVFIALMLVLSLGTLCLAEEPKKDAPGATPAATAPVAGQPAAAPGAPAAAAPAVATPAPAAAHGRQFGGSSPTMRYGRIPDLRKAV